MTKQPITQSQKRFQESIGSLFSSNPQSPELIFLKSSSDVGVQRNGGRNGAKYAPQSFLSYFKKLNLHPQLGLKEIAEWETANEVQEVSDFPGSQHAQAERIAHVLKKSSQSFVCHLGGGHDHIYPFLKALHLNYKNILVINVDAHADTRTDEEFHSGTPFRQFAQECQGQFTLLQVGLLPLANSVSTLRSLARGQQFVIWRDEIADFEKWKLITSQLKITKDTAVVFSLDADALNGSEMPGVSAVNGHGLTRSELVTIWHRYRDLSPVQAPLLGIYELNPVYDTLSMLSVRTLATFVYEVLVKR
jgi:formiminoglutamase